MTSENSRTEFAIVPFWENPSAQFLTRMMLVAAIIGCLSVGVGYLVGPLRENALIFALAAATVVVIFSTWRFWREYGGLVRIDNQQIVVETGAGRWVYGWATVQNIKLATYSQLGALACRLAGVDEHRPFVEISLTKRPRVALLGNRVGTNVVLGVPRLSKRLALYLVEPQEFLREAELRRILSNQAEA